MKDKIKKFTSKAFLFVFCVLFIAGGNMLFGAENSTISVALLTALLIMLKADLGYKVKQSAIFLPIILLVMVVSPRLASINVFLGIIINFASILFILTFSAFNLKEDNHVAFMLGYIFATGYNVTGQAFNKRVLEVLIVGIIIGGLYFVINRNKSEDYTAIDVVKTYKTKPENFHWYLKLASLLTLVMFVGDLIDFPNTIWINFTILSLTYHNAEEKVKRMKYRIPCAVLGSLIYFIVFTFLPQQYQSVFVLGLGFFIMFLSLYKHKTVANAVNALSSATAAGMAPITCVILRISTNLIGTAFAWVHDKIYEKVLLKIKTKNKNIA